MKEMQLNILHLGDFLIEILSDLDSEEVLKNFYKIVNDLNSGVNCSLKD